MSTLNSTNMNVSRPTTKVRHAPGGSSSINLSFDEKPLPVKSAFKAVFEPSEEPAPEPVVEAVEEPVKPAEPEVPAAVVAAAPPKAKPAVAVAAVSTASVTDKVGMVFVSTGSANEALKARTLEVLGARGVAEVTVASVMSPLQLPFALKQMAAKGTFTSLIAIAAFTEEVFASKEIAAAVMNGIVQVSMEQSVPVVPGFVFAASDKEAVVKGSDCPGAWVTSALALAKPDTFDAVVPTTTTAAPVKVSAPAEVPVEETATGTEPDKMDKVSEASKTARPQGAVDTTPVRGRHRGAGPSSIIFG